MRETVFGLKESQKLDVYSHGYGPKAFLYVCYGFMDGTYNTYGLWFIGALSNDRREVRLPPLANLYILANTFVLAICLLLHVHLSAISMHGCGICSRLQGRVVPIRVWE